MIQFQCPECGNQYKVPDEKGGQKGRCPKCKTVISIPSTSLPPTAPKSEPATERQKAYARSLGIPFGADITKAEMTRLITEAVDNRDEERFAALDELSDREGQAYEALRKEILAEIDEEDCRLSSATPEQMIEELESRNRGAILICFPIDELDFDDLSCTPPFEVSFTENMTEAQMRALICGLGAHIAKHAGTQ